MTVQGFNSLSISDKEKYIFEIIKNQKVTIANDLVFSNMIIFFQVALFNKKIIKAEAEPLQRKHLQELQKEYGKFSCLLINHENERTVKQYIFRSIEKISNQFN